jgi:ferric-dicitrate binding protein FerR (iron transport regulator)
MATGERVGGNGSAAQREIPASLSEYIDALPSGEPPARDFGERRRRMVPHLRAHATREHVRARRRRVVRRAALLFSTVGGAAVVLVAFTNSFVGPVRHAPTRPGAQIAVLDGTLWLDEGAARRALRVGEASGVDPTDVLEAPAELGTRVQLSDTATLTLDPSSRVGTIVADATAAADYGPAFEAVRLVRGRAHLKVRKLHGGQRFHVLTPDADVQVRGTEFDVELRPGATPGTCVRVQEGLVAVYAGGEHLVAPGQSWGCAETAPPPARAEAPVRRSPVAARPTASDLREQNAMFQAALEADRAGRPADAARLYHQLLARAPHGPLSAQARVNLSIVSHPR